MPDFDDDDFEFEDVWDILLPLLTNVLIIVLCCWICMKCCKCRRNDGEVLASPAVVITSTQHYPPGPNPMASPSRAHPPAPASANSSGTGYQQLQQQKPPANVPPMTTATSAAIPSQDPPTYEEAMGAGQQPAFNPHFGSGQQ